MKQKLQYLFLFQLLCCFIFELPIVHSWESLSFLDLSNNFLEGPLPTSICNSKNLEILVLANNNFGGEIPTCLGTFSSGLTALDLRNNSFNGTIPTNFSNVIKLKNLGLNGNNLEGPLPKSLTNCKSLEVLDVGNNRIRDSFPMWLTSLSELHVLILRSNEFYGSIGPSKSPFPKLRIVDLSYNNFTGTLPADLLKNLPAMMNVKNENELKYMGEGDGSYYLDSVTLVMKGLDMEIKRVLSIFTTIDLSVNKFEGGIPESIQNLHALRLLNVSYNNFTGSIPPVLGNLKGLESLDLSVNQFKGQIPWQLALLTFLAKFNVSQNHLSGRIPRGSQLDTFGEDSYYGNSDLCGFPLKDCVPKIEVPSTIKEKDFLDLQTGFTWKSVALGYVFGTIIGLFLGGLMFFTGQPKWLLKIIEQTQYQLKIKTKKNKLNTVLDVNISGK